MPPQTDQWISKVERACERFAQKHAFTYNRSEREISASFEIGCFHSLVEFYEKSCTVAPQNLRDGAYRYLTTPNGNPANFSFVEIAHAQGVFFLRQQVRIKSHIDPDIAFTPDMVVLKGSSSIDAVKDRDYASGKRSFFTVSSADVIAAHECKSMNPFPELLVSFIGHLTAAHEWLESADWKKAIAADGVHLAPTLFVGGTARGLHLRMIRALEKTFPVNILVGMHAGNWKLAKAPNTLVRLAIGIIPPVKRDITGPILE